MRTTEAAGAARIPPPPPGYVRAFEEEFDFVHRALIRYGVSRADSEDLAQEVFLVMWRKWADYDTERPLRPWLAGIAFKIAYHHTRRSGRFLPRGRVDLEDEAAEEPQQGESARDLVLRGLGRLSDRHRAVLVMHDVEGVPMQEIARRMSVPLFTAYSRLRLARVAFAKAIKAIEARAAATERRGLAPAALLALEREPTGAPPELRARAVARARAAAEGPEPPLPEALRESVPAPGPAVPWAAVATVGALAAAALIGWLAWPRSPASRATASASGERAGARPETPSRRAARAALPRPALLPVPGAGPEAPELDPALTLGHGLIGYWRFDEGFGSPVAHDLSGHGNDCVAHRLPDKPAPRRVSTEGIFGGALPLDGHSWLACQKVEPLAQLGSELSISVWVKRGHVSPERQTVISRALGSGQHYFWVRLARDDVEVVSHVWGGVMRARYPGFDGDWVHVAAVRHQTGATLYLDGVEAYRQRRDTAPSLGGGTSELSVGGTMRPHDLEHSTDRLDGALDELAIYDRALTPREVLALATRQQPRI